MRPSFSSRDYSVAVYLLLVALGSWSTDSQVISDLSTRFVSPTTLLVNWSVVFPLGNVTGYDVIVSNGDVEARRLTVDSNATSVEVYNLNQCHNYTVKVAANTSSGLGNYSTFEFNASCIAPRIHQEAESFLVKTRSPVVLPCNVSGFPDPTVYWSVVFDPETRQNFTKNTAVEISTGDVTQVFRVFDNGSLGISSVIHEDNNAEFYCWAVNQAGTAKSLVKLKVFGAKLKIEFELQTTSETFENVIRNRTKDEYTSVTKELTVRWLHEVDKLFVNLDQVFDVLTRSNRPLFSEGQRSITVDFEVTTAWSEKKDNQEALQEMEELVLEISDSGLLGNTTVKDVIILNQPPPAPTDLEASTIEGTFVVIKWKPLIHIHVYQIRNLIVQRKKAEDSNAEFINTDPIDAHTSEFELRGLDTETGYLVQIASHSVTNQVGISKILEFKTKAKESNALAIALGLGLPSAFFAVIVAFYMFHKYKKRSSETEETENPQRRLTMDELQQYGRTPDPNIYGNGQNQLSVLLPPEITRNWEEIPRSSLKIGEALGSGAFGVVMKGYLMRDNLLTECAVKMLKEHSSERELRDLYNELNIMVSIGNHPNVVSLIGACSVDGPLWIVVSIAENGSLKDFLIAHYTSAASDYQNDKSSQSLSDVEKLRFAHGIAKGMSHLAKVKFVHRDLASRNVLLGKNNIPMVSDFGLARDIYESGAYETTSGGKLPVRWMALESLQGYTYTTESDVWSFGVVLWEIETCAKVPYAALGGAEIVDYLRNGQRLSQPDCCSDETYKIMMDCWHEDPYQRPTFDQLVDWTEQRLSILADYHEFLCDSPADDDEEKDVPYDEIPLADMQAEFMPQSPPENESTHF